VVRRFADERIGEMRQEDVGKTLRERYPDFPMHSADFSKYVCSSTSRCPSTSLTLCRIFKDPPELCGATAAFLGSGKGKELRGMYWDCRQDIEKGIKYGRERLEKEGRYTLKVEFLEGYENEP
jgi:hypothetical protein